MIDIFYDSRTPTTLRDASPIPDEKKRPSSSSPVPIDVTGVGDQRQAMHKQEIGSAQKILSVLAYAITRNHAQTYSGRGQFGKVPSTRERDVFVLAASHYLYYGNRFDTREEDSEYSSTFFLGLHRGIPHVYTFLIFKEVREASRPLSVHWPSKCVSRLLQRHDCTRRSCIIPSEIVLTNFFSFPFQG